MNFNLNTKSTMSRVLVSTAAGLGLFALAACGQTSGSSDHAGAKPAASQKAKGADSVVNGGCLTEELSVKASPAEGTAGRAITVLTFKNLSDHLCKLTGFPGVSTVAGSDGHQVGGSAIRTNGYPVRTLSLKPYGKVYAFITNADIHKISSANCGPTQVRGWRIYPPNENAAKYIPAPNTVCANPNLGRPIITAVTTDSNPYTPDGE